MRFVSLLTFFTPSLLHFLSEKDRVSPPCLFGSSFDALGNEVCAGPAAGGPFRRTLVSSRSMLAKVMRRSPAGSAGASGSDFSILRPSPILRSGRVVWATARRRRAASVARAWTRPTDYYRGHVPCLRPWPEILRLRASAGQALPLRA